MVSRAELAKQQGNLPLQPEVASSPNGMMSYQSTLQDVTTKERSNGLERCTLHIGALPVRRLDCDSGSVVKSRFQWPVAFYLVLEKWLIAKGTSLEL